MRLHVLAAALALACAPLALSGCATAAGTTLSDAMKEIASDPRCGHTDRIQGNLGGLSANNLSLYLERTCPPEAVATTGTLIPAAQAPAAAQPAQ